MTTAIIFSETLRHPGSPSRYHFRSNQAIPFEIFDLPVCLYTCSTNLYLLKKFTEW